MIPEDCCCPSMTIVGFVTCVDIAFNPTLRRCMPGSDRFCGPIHPPGHLPFAVMYLSLAFPDHLRETPLYMEHPVVVLLSSFCHFHPKSLASLFSPCICFLGFCFSLLV